MREYDIEFDRWGLVEETEDERRWRELAIEEAYATYKDTETFEREFEEADKDE